VSGCEGSRTLTLNRQVAGSIPTAPTIQINRLARFRSSSFSDTGENPKDPGPIPLFPAPLDTFLPNAVSIGGPLALIPGVRVALEHLLGGTLVPTPIDSDHFPAHADYHTTASPIPSSNRRIGACVA
jgi:hypothetical protein